MKYNIRGKNVEITEGIKMHIEEKFTKLEKYLLHHEEITASVLAVINKTDHKLEVTIPTKNFTLRIEERHPDLYVAIDHAADKLERQIRKNKTRILNKVYSDNIKEIIFDQAELDEEDENENIDKVVRTKKISTKPMDVEEAILQMELLNHDFYVYYDVEIDGISVIYKRKDGNYGLIETA